MKNLTRIFALIACAVTLFTAIGCGEKKPSPDDPNSKSNASKTMPGASGGAGGAGASRTE